MTLPTSLAQVRFTRDRCQACKGTGRHTSGGSCRVCSEAPAPAPVERACVLMLTSTPRSNGRQLRVRCECMSGSTRAQVDVRTPFDHLGDVDTIPEGVALWDEHKQQKGPRP